MTQNLKQMEPNPMRLLAGACSLVLTLGLAHAGVAQQAMQSTAKSQPVPAASSQASTIDAFTPASFSALLPGANPARPVHAQTNEQEEEQQQPSKPGHEGVKVHGHWLLVLKNADGTVADRREFENSLITTTSSYSGYKDTSSGSQLMVAMLSGNLTVGDPGIGFVQGDVTGDPSTFCSGYNIPLTSTYCYVFTSSNSLWNQGPTILTNNPVGYITSSLGLTYRAIFTPTPAIVLSGNYTVPTGLTSIAAVQSLYGFCAPPIAFSGSTPYMDNNFFTLENSASFRNADLASVGCTSATNFNPTGEEGVTASLTSTAVTSNASGTPVAKPLAVTPGQIVQVTVTLSFS